MSFSQTADEKLWYSLTDFDHASESARRRGVKIENVQ